MSPPTRLCEYILIAPSPEVRTVFVKLVVFFCHFAINDEPLPEFEGSNLCEQVLIAVLSLLKSEVAEHGKHLPHYFSLFSMYAGLGVQEKHQLLKVCIYFFNFFFFYFFFNIQRSVFIISNEDVLTNVCNFYFKFKLNVPAIFMQVVLEEGPGPSIKYQYPDVSKLHQVVASLVRSSDVSSRCQSSHQMPVRPNVYVQPNVSPDTLYPLTNEAQELLFNRTG